MTFFLQSQVVWSSPHTVTWCAPWAGSLCVGPTATPTAMSVNSGSRTVCTYTSYRYSFSQMSPMEFFESKLHSKLASVSTLNLIKYHVLISTLLFPKKNLTQRPEKDRKHIASTFASSILCTVFLIIVNKVLYKYLKAELYGNHFKSSTLLF